MFDNDYFDSENLDIGECMHYFVRLATRLILKSNSKLLIERARELHVLISGL